MNDGQPNKEDTFRFVDLDNPEGPRGHAAVEIFAAAERAAARYGGDPTLNALMGAFLALGFACGADPKVIRRVLRESARDIEGHFDRLARAATQPPGGRA